MSLTTGMIVIGIGIAGICITLLMQVILIGVFSASRKRLLDRLMMGKPY